MQIEDLLARKSKIYERLSMDSDWIDLEFMERERTPQQAIELGIQMHVAGLSLSNTTSVLEELGVERSRKAVHDWVHKADSQPDEGRNPDHIAIDKTVIQINDKRFWLYAAVDQVNNHLLHVRLFHSTTTIAGVQLREEVTVK